MEIYNNLCENAIRSTAVGKKNSLFIGHPETGQRSAVIYSVLGSCRRHGINPAEYLHDVFERLPKAKTSNPKPLTPAAWAKARRAAARSATRSAPTLSPTSVPLTQGSSPSVYNALAFFLYGSAWFGPSLLILFDGSLIITDDGRQHFRM